MVWAGRRYPAGPFLYHVATQLERNRLLANRAVGPHTHTIGEMVVTSNSATIADNCACRDFGLARNIVVVANHGMIDMTLGADMVELPNHAATDVRTSANVCACTNNGRSNNSHICLNGDAVTNHH